MRKPILAIISTENEKNDKKPSTGQIPEANKISTGQYLRREKLAQAKGPEEHPGKGTSPPG